MKVCARVLGCVPHGMLVYDRRQWKWRASCP